MNLEQSLRSLAEDDAAARVPPHVDAAVMAAWDARCCERDGRERAVEDRRQARIAWAIAAGLAASLVAIAILERPRAVGEPQPVRHDGSSETSIATRPSPAIADTFALPALRELPQQMKRAPRPAVPLPQASAAYVLVPDAGVEAPLTMMRVRMSRSAFSRLGIPIANPDGDGMVDVDVLVGEDGVARSIRRASAVGWVDAK